MTKPDVTTPDAPPPWLAEWCGRHLGSRAVSVLFATRAMSEVHGLRLADGREVVVKARPTDGGRPRACVAVQSRLAAAGLPVAQPLTEATDLDGRTVHAEEWRPGGTVREDDGPGHAAQAAQALSATLRITRDVDLAPHTFDPSPIWVGWYHPSSDPWPRFDLVNDQQARTGIAIPRWLDDIQALIQTRLTRTRLRRVIGHADWEAQNLRWDGTRIRTMHDWDSLAALPESALVGAAAGAFASTSTPTLAPIASSEAFLDAYQAAAQRPFTAEELEVAWTASIYPAAHNARGEIVFETPPVAVDALRHQARERLRRGGAPARLSDDLP